MPSSGDLDIHLEFRSGAEILFGGKKTKQIQLDGTRKWTLQNLLHWMVTNILTADRTDFMQGDSVRPGILVLVNDIDWEILGELKYELVDGDHVLFISSLHGG